MIGVRLSLMKRADRPIFGCFWVRKTGNSKRGAFWISLSRWISFRGCSTPLLVLLHDYLSLFFFLKGGRKKNLKIVIIKMGSIIN